MVAMEIAINQPKWYVKLFQKEEPNHAKERGDNGLFITLVPNGL